MCIKTFVIWINGIRSHIGRIERLLSVPSDSIDHWIKLPPKTGSNAQRIRMRLNHFEPILWTSVCETITKIMYTDAVATHTHTRQQKKSHKNSTTTGSILYFDLFYSRFLNATDLSCYFCCNDFHLFVRLFVRLTSFIGIMLNAWMTMKWKCNELMCAIAQWMIVARSHRNHMWNVTHKANIVCT